MNLTRLALVLVLSGLFGAAYAEEAALGICDGAGSREKRTAQYNVESRKDTNLAFVAKLPCADETVAIKKCAVISVGNKKIQRFCFRSDRPAYYEYFDVIEYWDAPGERSSAQ
jgi:hypothetical protein